MRGYLGFGTMPERPLPNRPTYHQSNESSAYPEPELDSRIPNIYLSHPPYSGMAEDSNTSMEHVGVEMEV